MNEDLNYCWSQWVNPLTNQLEFYKPQEIILEHHSTPEEHWGKFIAWLNYLDPIPGNHTAFMGSIQRYKQIYDEANSFKETISITQEQLSQAKIYDTK